jgi:NAD(P)-dependent dehydrogenase (short-subunit alcohol dehydrogenase family)
MPFPDPPPLGTAMLAPDTFAGEVVVVTGGGTGLGKAIACEFARVGAAVGIVSRSEEHRQAGIDAVTAIGARAAAAPVDVRDADQIREGFDSIEAELGPITVLVNNASANFPVLAEELSPNGWRSVVDIILDGTYLCSCELARRLVASGRPGAILNILATQAITGGPGMVHTSAAKAGVDNLTKTLAVEWAPYGIRVNSLAPGMFYHENFREEFATLRGDRTDFDSRSPGGRTGRTQEIGWLATYACSRYATYLSGHTLVLDGAGWQRRTFMPTPYVPMREQLKDVLRPPRPERQR